MKLIKPNHFLFSILMLVAALLFLAGCGESGKNKSAASLDADGSFSTEIPLQLEKIPPGSTLTAELVIDGGAPITMTVNADNVSATTPELEAGSHSFIITYFLDEKRIASVSTKATIIAGQSTVITFDISQLDQDLDQDGFTGIDEVVEGSDPDNPDSTPPEGNAPTAKISFPPPVSLTDAAQITVKGTATDETGVSTVLVNGIAATTSDGFSNWQAVVPLSDGDNSLVVETSDTLGNVNTNAANASAVVSSVGTNSVSADFFRPAGVAIDAANNRVLVVDAFLDALIAVDLTTGKRVILSGGFAQVGTGPAFRSPSGVAIDVENNRALMLDISLDALMMVDLTTGNRTIFSGGSTGVGTGPVFVVPKEVALNAANNRALVLDIVLDALIAVDLTTGNRTILSGGSTGVGAGTAFVSPRGVALDVANNRVLVVDVSLDAVIAVDLNTGNRTILSSANVGSGSLFNFPQGITQEAAITLDVANNRALVIGSRIDVLISVDLTTGNRTILSNDFPSVGTGPPFVSPTGVTFDTVNMRALVIDDSLNALMTVDLRTGNRTILSNDFPAGGTGPAFVSPIGVTLDTGNERVLVIDDFLDALIKVDLSTGNRTFISTIFTTPSAVALDAVNNRVLVSDRGSRQVRGSDSLNAVDLTTGKDTTFISGSATPDGPLPPGLPPFAPEAFRDSSGLTLDVANNRVLMVDDMALFSIDLATRKFTALSSNTSSGPGTGPAFVSPSGVALDTANNRALVIDSTLRAIIAVNLDTGNRAIFSDDFPLVGAGPAFVSPSGVVPDAANNRALVTDSAVEALFAVDLDTGKRTILSGENTGTGPAFKRPQGIILDTENKLALVIDSGLEAIFAVDLENGERVIISR